MSEGEEKPSEKSKTQSNESDSQISHVSPFTRTIVDIHDLDYLLKKGTNHGVCGGHNLGTWYDLLKDYWETKSRTGNPSTVKSTVAKKVKKFGGFGQQDSNEFMTEFLSILNEDLNKSDKKEYRELKEKGIEESELECAQRFWKLHVERNDSIITDLFSGLLKSDVVCGECGFDNITFDPFDTLTLAIPSYRYLIDKVSTHMDTKIFYIPKYCIGTNCQIIIHIPKETEFKDIAEEINKIEGFPHKLDKYEKKSNKTEFIFAFDDLRKDENTQIIPLYMYSDKNISAFPRVLFLKDNMTFGEFKKQIYYYARSFINSPLIKVEEGKEEDNLDKKIDKILNTKSKSEGENQPINEVIDLIDKEYNQIFSENQNDDKIKAFFKDFPYVITFKNKFTDKPQLILFDGENNLENLKEFNITKDEDPITSLIQNKELCLNLVLRPESDFTVPRINLNNCVSFQGEDVGKRDTDTRGITLDDLLEYFCSNEHLEKGNEWKCGNCKHRVSITKKFSIFYVPKLLIICIKRFSKSGYGYDKNNILIEFPIENLDMGKYICGPDKAYSKYDLFAVSQHYGGTGGGHYTAVCKNIDGNWYSYNDSSVSLTSASSAVSSAAYVLFYRRKNW